MNTTAHINQFLSTHQTGLPGEPLLRWCHQHPTALKVIEAVSFFFGAILVATAASLGSMAIGLTGAALAVAATVAFFALDAIAPAHHDMKNHAFKPARCEGGELYYDGDLPILSIDGNDPLVAGKAQGYLLADVINKIRKRFDFALHTLDRRPRAHEIPALIQEVKETIPRQYLTELEGLVQGFNKWVDEQSWPRPKKMTLEEAILSHLMPDAHNLPMGGFFQSLFLRRAPAVACSSIVDRDQEKGIVFGRNMDWPSLGLTGQYSFIKHTKMGNSQIVEVSVPGLIGTLTGMNNRGLSLSMNVCPGNGHPEVAGMPALFYNRQILENCNNLNDVRRFPALPIGPYHLTVADPNGAGSFHFYQETPFRELGNEPLATFNNRMDPKLYFDQHYTKKREKMIDEFYQGVGREMDHEKLIEAVVGLSCINNYETTHTVVIRPGISMKVAFDNAFSGNSPLLEVPIRKLFGQVVEEAVAAVDGHLHHVVEA